MKDKPLFLPGLNGIRAIAAVAVLFSHINMSLPSFNITALSLFGFRDSKPQSYILGEHAVTMFFVLSGFLITYLLLKEYEKTKTIQIRAFYMRRILRIWPLYFLYISILISFLYFFLDWNFNLNLLYYLFFTANVPFVNGDNIDGMYHLWSISVEEQFYLFWPLVFLFLIKRQFLPYLMGILVCLSVFRIGLWFYVPYSKIAIYSYVNRFDCMFFGAIGAFLFFKNHFLINVLNSKVNQIFCWTVLLLMILNKFSFLNSIVEVFIVEYVTLTLIIGQIKGNNKFFNLEVLPFTYLGKISFGIYVYHPLIIIFVAKYFHFENYTEPLYYAIFIYFLIISITLLISHLSFFYFEKRFAKMKHKFSIIYSSNEQTESQKTLNSSDSF